MEEFYRKLTSIDRDRKKWVFDIYYLSRFDQLPAHLPMCIRDSDCYALVYSTTSRETFNSMRLWYNTIRSIRKDFLSTPHPSRRVERSRLLALIATKCDMPDSQRQVSVNEGVKLARELGCPFYETSAKTAHNVDAVFEDMGRTCRDAMRLYSTSEVPPLEELRKATKGRLRSNVNQRFSSVQRKIAKPWSKQQ
jgi:GTPase SAR1 family protein